MRSTLFYVPHEILGVPLLGFGWLLLLLVIGCIAWTLWLARQGQLASELLSGLPVWLIAAALVISGWAKKLPDENRLSAAHADSVRR